MSKTQGRQTATGNYIEEVNQVLSWVLKNSETKARENENHLQGNNPSIYRYFFNSL